MNLACRSALTVISGVDPNPAKKEHRNFLDEKYAASYLHRLADLDLNFGSLDEKCTSPRETLQYAASVEERFGESVLITPPPDSNKVLSFKN
jgi:hypothetical protein